LPRIDRLATLYAFRPWQRLTGRAGKGIPILMYHSISTMQPGRPHPYYWTHTAPAVFADQMRFLSQQGYAAVSLEEAVSSIVARHSSMQSSSPVASHSSLVTRRSPLVVITFDDGYQDFYTQAFPILRQHGFSATVYLPTGFIGDGAHSLNGFPCLTWSQASELHRAGIDFGSHTVTHPRLSTVSESQLRHEVEHSKNTIQDRLGAPVTSFAYPYAFPEADRAFTARLRGLLQSAGYLNGVSTIIGAASATADRFFLPRLPVNSADDLPFFQAKLEGAYNWLHAVQYAQKAGRFRLAAQF
jgi:peptidoglycan/xylan/chitin deacetylase (PgdA/CDA1 family)